MRVLLFLFCFILLSTSSVVFAVNNCAIYTSEKTMTMNEDNTITFDTKDCTSSTVAKPFTSSGDVFIYDYERKMWIAGTESWVYMPSISGILKIKVNGIGADVFNVWFQLQDKTSSKINTTSSIKVIDSTLIKSYGQELSNNFSDLSISEPNVKGISITNDYKAMDLDNKEVAKTSDNKVKKVLPFAIGVILIISVGIFLVFRYKFYTKFIRVITTLQDT